MYIQGDLLVESVTWQDLFVYVCVCVCVCCKRSLTCLSHPIPLFVALSVSISDTLCVSLSLVSLSFCLSRCPCLNRALYLHKRIHQHTHVHTHTHTHTEPCQLAVAVAAVLQMPQCAVISREIWGCYKLCTLNNRRRRISPLCCLHVYSMCVCVCACVQRGCVDRVFAHLCTTDIILINSTCLPLSVSVLFYGSTHSWCPTHVHVLQWCSVCEREGECVCVSLLE